MRAPTRRSTLALALLSLAMLACSSSSGGGDTDASGENPGSEQDPPSRAPTGGSNGDDPPRRAPTGDGEPPHRPPPEDGPKQSVNPSSRVKAKTATPPPKRPTDLSAPK